MLDTAARQAIHALVNAIREKLNELTLPEAKRESLFNKLNQFAAEVDSGDDFFDSDFFEAMSSPGCGSS